MELNDITAAVWKAAGILFSFYVQYAIYIAARGLSAESKRSKLQVGLRSAFAALVLGYMAWTFYGTHVEDADPLYGGGTEVVDFEPTEAERNQHGVTILAVVSVLIGTGTVLGLRDRDNKGMANQNSPNASAGASST